MARMWLQAARSAVVAARAVASPVTTVSFANAALGDWPISRHVADPRGVEKPALAVAVLVSKVLSANATLERIPALRYVTNSCGIDEPASLA